MKKLILVLFIFFGTLKYNYAQSYIWADSVGRSSSGIGIRTSTDESGNVFLTASYNSPTITIGATTFTNAGYADIYIVKYDASGNVLWAKSAGGSYDDYWGSICTDAGGNVFATGVFSSPTITFGSTTLTNTGGQNVFIVKYDASGNVLWARSAQGSSYDWGNGISTDASSNVFVTGSFKSPTITFGTTTLTNAGSDDVFIVKYDASGNLVWAKSMGGSSSDGGQGISTDVNGNLLVTGYFSSTSITFGTVTLTNAGGDDVFIVKYDASGNILWAKSAGGSSYGISTDASGNVFIIGSFNSSTITFGTTTLTNSGLTDVFIVKYDVSGNVLWAKSGGGNYYDYVYGICTDASGNVFVTGYYESPTIAFGSTTFTNAGGDDIFIVKYDASGNILWAKSSGGNAFDDGFSIAADANGNIFVAGFFMSTTITFGTTTFTNAGGEVIFIVKLSGSSVTNVKGGNNNSMSLKVYPNPFISFATLKIEMLNPAKATVAMADVTGKVVHYFGQGITLQAGENTFTYPENLSPGVYVVKVFTDHAMESLKCVKVE